jgi:hypothetical protein
MAKSRHRHRAKLIPIRGARLEPPAQQRQASPQRPSHEPLHRHRLVRAAKWLLGTLVAVVGVVAGVYQIGGGPPWPADPEVHPRDTLDSSSLILPFLVTNPSILFGMDVSFTCGIDVVYAKDTTGADLLVTDAAFANGAYSLGPRETVNFPCDASRLLQVKNDGSLSLFGSSTVLQNNSGHLWETPFQILKMCVWVGAVYKIAGVARNFRSKIFMWPAAQGHPQWIEGGLVPAPPTVDGPPNRGANALRCSSAVRVPYIFVSGPGRAQLVFK